MIRVQKAKFTEPYGKLHKNISKVDNFRSVAYTRY
jgi:hypothetical protein